MEPIYQWLKENLADKGYEPATILDIGAWNGFWTLNCKTFWKKSHYTCIEPGYKHEKKLINIADEYHMELVGSREQEIDFYINKVGYTKGASIFKSPDKKVVKRKMVTLKSLVGEKQYNFIKQDVQGSELLIMQGSPDVFKKAEYVLNEVNVDKIGDLPSLQEMNQYMRSLGFHYHTIIAEHESDPKQVDALYSKNRF